MHCFWQRILDKKANTSSHRTGYLEGSGAFLYGHKDRSSYAIPFVQKSKTKTFIYCLYTGTANGRVFDNYSIYKSARIIQNAKNNPVTLFTPQSLKHSICRQVMLQDWACKNFSAKANIIQRVTFCSSMQFRKCDCRCVIGKQKYICYMVLKIFPYSSQLTLFQQLCV